MSYHVVSCHVMSCHVMSCQVLRILLPFWTSPKPGPVDTKVQKLMNLYKPGLYCVPRHSAARATRPTQPAATFQETSPPSPHPQIHGFPAPAMISQRLTRERAPAQPISRTGPRNQAISPAAYDACDTDRNSTIWNATCSCSFADIGVDGASACQRACPPCRWPTDSFCIAAFVSSALVGVKPSVTA